MENKDPHGIYSNMIIFGPEYSWILPVSPDLTERKRTKNNAFNVTSCSPLQHFCITGNFLNRRVDVELLRVKSVFVLLLLRLPAPSSVV